MLIPGATHAIKLPCPPIEKGELNVILKLYFFSV